MEFQKLIDNICNILKDNYLQILTNETPENDKAKIQKFLVDNDLKNDYKIKFLVYEYKDKDDKVIGTNYIGISIKDKNTNNFTKILFNEYLYDSSLI